MAAFFARAQEVPAKFQLHQQGGDVICIGFSFDSQWIFVGSLDSFITVWNTTTWKQTAVVAPAPPPKPPAGEAHQDEFRGLTACASYPDRQEVLIATGGDSVAKYGLPSGKQISNVELRADSLAISPDGQTMAFGSGSKVHFASTRDFKTSVSFDSGASAAVLSYSPRGDLLAVALEGIGEYGVEVWNPQSQTKVAFFQTGGNAQQLNFSPDGRSLAAAVWSMGKRSEDWGGAQVWNIETQRRIERLHTDVTPASSHRNHVYGVQFSPDGTLLVSGDTGGGIRVWKTSDWSQCAHLSSNGLDALTISSDSRWLAAGGADTISIWNFPEATKSCH